MGKIKLSNGTVYPVEDYAAHNIFLIRLNNLEDVAPIIAEMTDENLSEIQFLTAADEVTGIYKGKTYSRSIIEKDEAGYVLGVCLTDTAAHQAAKMAEYEAALRTMGVEV